ncbi:DUF488 domain-containing protein [Paenibacillus sp. CAA11]|uniref:DUF488 domain-containing protein n=1 Tax=Paenibacillus sp. CAA11 TaxID=1532905 RepID=UPI000D3545F5|nr:DUF488 domain-containing protein [Paenibacillus sp. CAA11]AWB44601.1 DUF488 domain-containing protein [Paenibacillus sp. CAA11]
MSHIAEENLVIKRVYEPYDPEDGYRVLVDRLWPRGVAKERAMIHEWMKDIAPSPGLRKWFGHDPERFNNFTELYIQELEQGEAASSLAAKIRDLGADQKVTLVYAAKDPVNNHAIILRNWLLNK